MEAMKHIFGLHRVREKNKLFYGEKEIKVSFDVFITPSLFCLSLYS